MGESRTQGLNFVSIGVRMSQAQALGLGGNIEGSKDSVDSGYQPGARRIQKPFFNMV